MDTDGEWLHLLEVRQGLYWILHTYHGTIFKRQILWKLVGEIGRCTIVFAECTVVWRGSSKYHIRAELECIRLSMTINEAIHLIVSGFTLLTKAARCAGFYCHSRANLKMFNRRANCEWVRMRDLQQDESHTFGNYSSRLVAQDHGIFYDKVTYDHVLVRASTRARHVNLPMRPCTR